MSKSILGVLVAWFFSFALKAEQPIFNISSVDANPGQIINIDFHVDNFTNIISAQFSVNWNPTVIKFKSIKNLNANVPGLSIANFGTPQNLLDQGKFTFGWFESSVTPITIPDNSLFFTVEFEVLGDPCDASTVAITNDPTEIEVAEAGEVPVGLVSNNGTVTVPGTGCSQDIHLIGNSIIGACNSNVCIQFTVENFVTVGAMEFSLTYDPTVLQFDKFQNFAPLLSFGTGNTNLLMPGLLRVLWFNSNVVNDTLADGTVLFEICFDVIGTGGQSSDITFGNDPPPGFSDIDGNPHTVTITPANITAQCALEGFALIADTVCTQPNTVVCMDVKVNDFDDIVAMQFSMNWDSTKFIFDHVEGFGLTGLDINAFGTPGFPDVKQGQLTVSWIDLSLQGVTLPDFATIFRLCLKAVGPVNTSSPVTFTANPIDIEILNAEDSVLVYGLLQGQAQIKTNCVDPGCDVSYLLNVLYPPCPGECTGVMNLQVIENCPESPTYLWSNGATSEDITGLCDEGIYCVTITVGSKVIIACDTLLVPDPFAITSQITNPTPGNASNGLIDILTVTGGTPPYTYHWSYPPPNGTTTQDLSNIPAGTYTVTITDSHSCQFVPDPFVVGADLTAAITNVSCNGGMNGAINLQVNYGTAPYTFNWNTTPPRTSEDIDNLKAGIYCVTVTDNSGSTRDSCFTVTQPDPLNVTASLTHDVNENGQGAIDMNVTGGLQPYSYQWADGPTSQDRIGLSPGTYCVTITYGQGCTTDTCFTIFGGGINVSLTAKAYGNFQTSCGNTCDGMITSNVVGGNAPFTYQWSNTQTTPDLMTNVCEGTYSLTVTDQDGQTATATIVITSPPDIVMVITSTLPTDFNSFDGALSAVVNGGTPPYTYSWSGPVSGNTAALNNIPAGSYLLQIVDNSGCQADTVIHLFNQNIDCYQGITVITPNNDAKNDYFIIACVLDDPNHLYIYNRLGGLVYETDNYQNNWDGVDQDDVEVPDGGYLWVLEVYGPAGTKQLFKGVVNVVRTAD